ncbi:MAG: phosphoglucosamine mutase [Gemmatimonadetes bacterium]|nr:phosphoglucosamine mutase [Gemmatimonadota bacterium]
MSLKLSISGARGIVGESLTPDVVTRLAAAFAEGRQGGTVLVGGDPRISGPVVRNALIAGLNGAGCSVLDCGICMTPSMLYAVKKRGAAGGVLVTASHNPIEWNALKFVGGDGFFLGAEDGARLKAAYETGDLPWVAYDALGSEEKGPRLFEDHRDAILNHPWIDVPAIRARRFRVVVDGTGGAGSKDTVELLHALGCDVVPLHCEMTGFFPRPPEPKPENLGELCDLVKTKQAAVGFALDPDGDRLSLVAETGRALSEEATVALSVAHVLKKAPGPVVVNLSTSRVSEDLAANAGVPFYRTPVGEAHVSLHMREVGAAIGGEGNGGVMVPSLHPMRDAAMGMAVVLQSLTEAETGLDDQERALPQYVILKSVVSADTFDRDDLVAALVKRFGKARVDERDGLHLSWERSWLQIRSSNTEPIVRLFAEAPTEDEAARLRDAASEVLS